MANHLAAVNLGDGVRDDTARIVRVLEGWREGEPHKLYAVLRLLRLVRRLDRALRPQAKA